MIIQSSSVAMSAKHKASSYQQVRSLTLEARGDQAVAEEILKKQKEGQMSSVDALATYEKEQEKKQSQQEKENMAKSYQDMLSRMRKLTRKEEVQPYKPEEDSQIKMLRQILAALNGKKLSLKDLEEAKRTRVLDLTSENRIEGQKLSRPMGGTVWQKVTASEVYVTETESMAFAATGMATTSDGRQISFGMEVSMSRAFCAKYSEFTCQDYIRTDPLVINLDQNVTGVTDMKFMFDLNSDGEEEEISFAKEGSGFLVYDQNEDGIVNNGQELFGTKSGDGFKDLSKYDSDGNGWIDEADDIFKKLKVWTKDEDGKDHLIDLKKANVGAIYLGNVDTEFSINDESNKNLALLRKTGIYLKENGGVGTVAHVDLTL